MILTRSPNTGTKGPILLPELQHLVTEDRNTVDRRGSPESISLRKAVQLNFSMLSNVKSCLRDDSVFENALTSSWTSRPMTFFMSAKAFLEPFIIVLKAAS
ncbi:hypothetical protein DPMN_141751 [Dreissena polymorpha]|uniref:Uncharacterized protein n=1 Tax=Dreissena polymorpha TaxID=45954 RepID=A0A9D4GAL3_DREPO|nr:hypothetical protein DPMN_141751 [Dreissena polymorpha]